jgi:hypothetical protein
MLHVASVFINRRDKRAQAEKVPMCGGGPHVHAHQQARARSSTRAVGAGIDIQRVGMAREQHGTSSC